MKYMRTTMTGSEGYKAMKFFLLRCHDLTGNEYAKWLALALDSDPAIMEDWEDSVRDMLSEREKFGNSQLADAAAKLPVFKECDCWLGYKPSEVVEITKENK